MINCLLTTYIFTMEQNFMHYVIGDVHNELGKMTDILEQIQPGKEDYIYFLGDLFDRGVEEPDPAGVYFKYTGIPAHCIWIMGNHDYLLAHHIKKYYTLPPRKRVKYLMPYSYNSFELLKQRMTEVDMMNLAERILQLPMQVELNLDGKKYLLSHAATSEPEVMREEEVHLYGVGAGKDFFKEGIKGYISILGHTQTASMSGLRGGKYLDEEKKSVWTNVSTTVYLMDCGCGFTDGRLACMCLETGERFYSGIEE